QLIRVVREDGSVVIYEYDGLGRRIEKDVAGVVTQYIYDTEDVLLELDGTNNIVARYTNGPGIDEPLIMEKAGQFFPYHTDGLGSVTELTNSAGTVVQTYTYSSFGKIEFQSDPSFDQPYRFTSREFDPETGLYFYRARSYDQLTGRFLQEDPLGITGATNLYFMTGNNPVNFRDPDGRLPLPLITGTVGAVAGLLGNAIGQVVSNGGFGCFDVNEVLIAGGVGFAAGAAAPFVATSYVGAAALGALANLTQYGITQGINGQRLTAAGTALSIGTGAAGGAVAGPVTRYTGLRFAEGAGSRLNPAIARSLNQQRDAAVNTGLSNLIRNVSGGVAANLSPSAGEAQCGCP
ncbi:hypothetical protein MYX65_05755, partial [Acidobacteria bacterium AH-259-L09]|nr:hypothetical protein [Acidobacteria bacterium AH-259-L09]